MNTTLLRLLGMVALTTPCACGSEDDGARESAGPALTSGDSSAATSGDTSAGGSTSTSAGETTGSSSTTGITDPGGTSDDSDGSSGGSGPKFDTLIPDAGAGCGDGGDVSESFIWIANSTQGTVSKIDTRELVEVGRYLARPDGAGSPSRTSVSLNADVVVLSRAGGATKIYADPSNCEESNGTPGIQTSGGGGQWLPWDEEECRAWHTPFAYTNMRAVAWTSGTYDEDACAYGDQKVWVAGNTSDPGSTQVHRLNGDDGTVEDTVPLPDLELPLGHGAYGAAVDGSNDLWIVQIYENKLVRVAYDDLSVEMWDEPHHAYGMTIAPDGRVYACNRHIDRFDPTLGTWDSALVEDWQGYYGHAGGCMVDANGVLWKTIDEMLYGVDADSLQVVDMVALPEGMQWGVAVDVDGYIWTIPRNGTTAYRVDPTTHDIQSIGGLVGAYTYSDMTGFLLQSVAPG